VRLRGKVDGRPWAYRMAAHAGQVRERMCRYFLVDPGISGQGIYSALARKPTNSVTPSGYVADGATTESLAAMGFTGAHGVEAEPHRWLATHVDRAAHRRRPRFIAPRFVSLARMDVVTARAGQD
jgi:hypothetical protein